MAVQEARFFDRIQDELRDVSRTHDRQWLVFDPDEPVVLGDSHQGRRLRELVLQMVAGAGVVLGEADPYSAALEELRRYCEEVESPLYSHLEGQSFNRDVDTEPRDWRHPMISDACAAASDYCEHLKSRVMLAQMRLRRGAARRRPSKVGRPKRQPKSRRHGAELTSHRRGLVRAWVVANDCSMAGLSRRVGISQDAIRAMIRADRARYAEEKLTKLLTFCNISKDEWNATKPD